MTRLLEWERLTYDNFGAGDYGDLGGAKAPNGSFAALNMIVTADGYLMPRPGLFDASPSDMPNGKVVSIQPTTTAGAEMMFIVGNTVYTYNRPAKGTKTSIGTLGVTPTTALYAKQGTDRYYVTVPGDTSYELRPVSGNMSALTSAPGGTECEIYGVRLLIAGADEPYRVQFSDPDNFNSWPADNFFDIGNKNWQITSLHTQNNHLAVFLARGKYVITGVPGVNAVERQAERAESVLHPGQTAIDEEDRIWYIPVFKKNPDSFNGVRSAFDVEYLNNGLTGNRDGDSPTLPLVRGVAESTGDKTHSTLLYTQGAGDNKMLLYHNGIWTRHQTSVAITGMVRGGETGDFYVTDGGDTSTPGKIYSIQFTDNRPALTTDTFTQPGDNSTTPVNAFVSFPENSMPGYECAVEQVIVHFQKYNTGTSVTNHFQLEVNSIGRLNANDAQYTATWDEAVSGAGASIGDNKRGMKKFGVKNYWGNGFQISLRDIRGIKIKSVDVLFQLDRFRPVPH